MLVNCVFDYYTDVLDVPANIAVKLKHFQRKSDKWLFNKQNDHPYWIKNDLGKKLAIASCSDSFLYWLNEIELKEKAEKATIIERNLKEYDKSLPTIFF